MKKVLFYFFLLVLLTGLTGCGGGGGSSSSGGGGSGQYDGNYAGNTRAVLVENGSVLNSSTSVVITNNQLVGLHSANFESSNLCSPTQKYDVNTNGTFQWNHTSTCRISGDVCTITFSGNGSTNGQSISAKGVEKWSCVKIGLSTWTKDFTGSNRGDFAGASLNSAVTASPIGFPDQYQMLLER